ncbi:MAG: glycoside hydrolase family 15 protein [Spirochaetota bacterium]|nr:glycoside hydrolase family 15 protein [Spirochaetota bacterium]
MKGKIEYLIEISKKIIIDCCLENGAIVAANPTKNYYPKEAKNYFYVWPRDASFVVMAAEMLKMDNIIEHFIEWVRERAEGWNETGLLYEKYTPNGLLALNRFQPDQTGSLLFAVCNYCSHKPTIRENYKEFILHSADGICKVWNNDHFSIITNDLWEERLTFPDLKDNFNYSLASCISGLSSAYQLYPDEKYINTASKMKEVLIQNAERRGHFFRSFGEIDDERIDASLLGIVWPFNIIDTDNKLAITTIQEIEQRLVRDMGVHRYEHDDYDGWMHNTIHRNKGAGFWPLLNFWMSIVLYKMGNREKAIQYFNTPLLKVDKYIPEQIFNNNIQKSVSPLCWSHTMYLLASKELEII